MFPKSRTKRGSDSLLRAHAKPVDTTHLYPPPPSMISSGVASAAFSLLVSLLLLPRTPASAAPPPVNASLHILQDVVKAISWKQKWDWENVSASKLDLRRARYGSFQKYEFRIRIGKADLFFKFTDDIGGWKKFRNFEGNLGDLVKLLSSKSGVRSFKVDGPVELRAGGDSDLRLSLPLNTTHGGLKRVLVGKGITVEVNGAHEVFLSYEPDEQSSGNGAKSGPVPYSQTLCMPSLPVHIIGPASLVAYKTRNPDVPIETHSSAEGMIELLPEKCYPHNSHTKHSCPIDSLSSRIATMEQVLRSLMGSGTHQKGVSGFVKANIKASTYVRFQIQLERNLNVTATNRTRGKRLDEWRTRPGVERVWFEVLGKVEPEKVRPVVVKKVKTFKAVDTVELSSLLSNISLTKFRPVLVPSEALTLDVKW